MFTVMLVDDQPAILAGMTTLIESTGIAKVVATETNGETAIATIFLRNPDLILVDVSLGPESGIDIARRLLATGTGARILAVSAHANSVYVRGMLNAGASGYMLKDNSPTEMLHAISTVMQGGQWIGAGLSVDPI